jgi:hypothetical protein
MVKKLNYKKDSKNKKGLSTIVITVILIAVSMAAVVLVWGIVKNMINKQISSSESCFGNYNKIKLDGRYTCYERISSTNYSLRFSLSVGEISVDRINVYISSDSATGGYAITNVTQNISGLSMYPSGISEISLPNKNTGLTYKADGFTSGIDGIQIAPVIGGNTCEVSDSISQIENCALMT